MLIELEPITCLDTFPTNDCQRSLELASRLQSLAPIFTQPLVITLSKGIDD